MKKVYTILFQIYLIFLFSAAASSQVTYEASIANPSVSGDTVFFDIFLRATNNSNPLYLGDADFVLFFNNANFTGATFEYLDGTNYFLNSNGTQTSSYNDIITPDILSPGNILVVNLPGVVFSNQTQFNTRVAKIDTNSNTHKFGTFFVTGISNPSGTLDLLWKTSPPGVSTVVLSFDPITPWNQSLASGTFINPGPIYLSPDDVGISSIVSPAPGQIVNANGSDVVAYVKNLGGGLVSDIDVYFNLNGGTPVGPVVVAGPIAQGDSAMVTFTGANQLTSMTDLTGTVRIYTDYTGDGNHSNDTGTVSNVFLRVPPSSFPYFSDFSESPTPYTASGSANLWGIDTATNPSGTTGDLAVRAFFWDVPSGFQILRSTLIDLTGTTNPLLSFYRAYTTYLLGPGNDQLEVLVSTNGGLTWSAPLYQRAWFSVPSLGTLPAQNPSFIPSAAGQWMHNLVDLSAYAGQEIVIGFNAITDYGNNLWIDNIKVSDANNISLIPVNAPGLYGNLATNGVQINFTALRPGLGNGVVTQTDNQGLWTPENAVFGEIEFAQERGNLTVKDASTRSRNNAAMISPDASEGVLALSRIDDFPINNVFETNLTATTFNGAIYTPDVIADRYWEIAFSGDDYISTATYDIIIDISTQLGITAYDSLYIVKRVDQNSPWVCLNTITNYEDGAPVSLIATGLTGFSQFGIASADGTLPVDISEFNALVDRNNVTLNWTTTWEVNNDRFEIQRRIAGNESQWITTGSIPGNGNTNEPKMYSYFDRELMTGVYEYRLIQFDYDGNSTADFQLNQSVEIGVPQKFELAQNYPNPFNPVTKIGFEIPVEGLVKLIVYDISGREVATLVNEVKTPGYYQKEFNGSNLSSGVYFYRLVTNQSVITKRLVLLK